MIKLLESTKFEIPKVFLVTERVELKEIPIGVPFIYGDSYLEETLIRLLEHEVLYQNAIKTGYPFNFRKILEDNGYLSINDFKPENTTYLDYSSEDNLKDDFEIERLKKLDKYNTSHFYNFIRDSSCYVNIEKIKSLNIMPTWLDRIEESIATNIHNFSVFNPNMYNKKLEGIYGAIEMSSPARNLIIIDISGSIPRGVSSTCLALAKNLAESFYADLMITGSITTLYKYEEIHTLDVRSVYEINGMNNDQYHFKKLLTSEKKVYKTVIAFGDDDSPNYVWNNRRDIPMTDVEGRKINLWEVDHLISFHTKTDKTVASYGRWFSPKSTENIKDWVKYLN